MSKNKPIDDLSRSIRALETKSSYIRSLRFPNYRNLRIDSELPFDFPITILLGRNGTNKSSILHALYGCPLGQSVADFWFETQLDAIPLERNGRKQSVIHRYRAENDEIVECIKLRAPRGAKDPDYWEAAKHSRIYGLPISGARVRPIKLNVIHLDFRGELPAFDKYFYFPDQKHLLTRARYAKQKKSEKLRRGYRKQDYLRRRSGILKREITEKGLLLSQEELDVLKYILERDYISGKVLKHSLFHGHEGWTILFKTNHLDGYSDAFAGSGESAAALLVHNILRAPEKSLILLDEPETSLHPRAQQRILEFIAHQAVRKSLQVVMATHSIYLAKGLPQKAIRVLILEHDGSVEVRTDLSANEALHEIGTLSAGKIILVEDERAKHIILSALKLLPPQASSELEVIVREGGTSRIYRDIQAYANSERRNVFIILDGDHNPNEVIPEDEELPQGEDALNKMISRLTSGNNSEGPDLNFVNAKDRTRYIRFLKKFVRFLPKRTPEDLVWDEDEVKKLLCKDLPQRISQEQDPKKRLQMLVEEMPGFTSDTIFNTLLAKFLKDNGSLKSELIQVIEEIRSIAV